MGTTKNVETTPRTIALTLLREGCEGVRRADRAMAHALLAALHAGLGWPEIKASTGLSDREIGDCVDRWSADDVYGVGPRNIG